MLFTRTALFKENCETYRLKFRVWPKLENAENVYSPKQVTEWGVEGVDRNNELLTTWQTKFAIIR